MSNCRPYYVFCDTYNHILGRKMLSQQQAKQCQRARGTRRQCRRDGFASGVTEEMCIEYDEHSARDRSPFFWRALYCALRLHCSERGCGGGGGIEILLLSTNGKKKTLTTLGMDYGFIYLDHSLKTLSILLRRFLCGPCSVYCCISTS